MMDDGQSRRQLLITWALVSTVVAELVTVFCRIAFGQSAAQFNATDPPLLLQIHHMFWSVPLFAAAAVVRSRIRVTLALVGIGLGLIASDLLHHFAVLPLWKGNTGWHWP